LARDRLLHRGHRRDHPADRARPGRHRHPARARRRGRRPAQDEHRARGCPDRRLRRLGLGDGRQAELADLEQTGIYPETVVTQLAIDAYAMGRVSEANGWTERALMLTEGLGPSEGRALALALRAHVAMLGRNDAAETLVLSEQALEAARAAGSTDVEIVALALE